MKKFFKAFGAVVIAIALVSVGYAMGSRAGENSITSALPHLSLNHEQPSASPEMTLLPLKESDKPQESKEENKKTDSSKSDNKPTEPEKTGRTVVKTASSAAQDNWTTLNQYSCDMMNNGDSCTVTLYTSAETDDGEVLWDDGQSWVVEISDGDGGYYTLLDKYIKNGTVYFEVNELESDKKTVTVFIKTSAGLEVKQYTYGSGGFIETTLYNSGSQNTMYSSMPDYQ